MGKVVRGGWVIRDSSRKVFKSYLPEGRSGRYIYVVTLKEHDGVVKVGRTARWAQRRRAYATWNLSDGDAIDREMLFTITDEQDSDIGWIEAEVLGDVVEPRRFGSEWFVADFDDVCRSVARTLERLGIDYV